VRNGSGFALTAFSAGISGNSAPAIPWDSAMGRGRAGGRRLSRPAVSVAARFASSLPPVWFGGGIDAACTGLTRTWGAADTRPLASYGRNYCDGIDRYE
jgi:hypothetical protein